MASPLATSADLQQMKLSGIEEIVYLRQQRERSIAVLGWAKQLIGPEFWREVSLTTVKGRPYSRAVGALVYEAVKSA